MFSDGARLGKEKRGKKIYLFVAKKPSLGNLCSKVVCIFFFFPKCYKILNFGAEIDVFVQATTHAISLFEIASSV